MNYTEKSREATGLHDSSDPSGLHKLFALTWQHRQEDPSLQGTQVYRCFNGFTEGLSGLVVDRFGSCLVISNHQKQPAQMDLAIQAYVDFARNAIPGVDSILLKTRYSADPKSRKGVCLLGERLVNAIKENGTTYALDLRLHQDNSFYPDTRGLREWLQTHSSRKSVLNTFAYTGSLGIAALSGSALMVVQSDINPNALEIARLSYRLNEFEAEMKLDARDFFITTSDSKRRGHLFDIVILDAPVFSETKHGRVDLVNHWGSLVNKLRPLVAHEGKLVLINNALFVSGEQLMAEIKAMEASGYLSLDTILPIPADTAGYPQTRSAVFPVDPSPFNHPTKIVVLDVVRKDKKRANMIWEKQP